MTVMSSASFTNSLRTSLAVTGHSAKMKYSDDLLVYLMKTKHHVIISLVPCRVIRVHTVATVANARPVTFTIAKMMVRVVATRKAFCCFVDEKIPMIALASNVLQVSQSTRL